VFRRILTTLAIGAGALALAAVPAQAQADAGVPVQVLLPNNRIVTVTTAQPNRALSDVRVSGLAPNETLVGIDRRPLDGLVYGVATSSFGTNVYTITATGQATLAFTLTQASLDPAAPGTGAPVELSGRRFGVDFNPAADALRIVSDTGQNLRALPSARNVVFNGTPVPRPIGATFTDGNLSSTGVTAVAYTNNDNDPATATTLMDIDTDDDVLFDQNPPNNGTLVNPRPLSRTTSNLAAFDIVTSGGTNTAYAILGNQPGRSRVSRLVTIDLTNGSVTVLGSLGRFEKAIGMAF
jgi:hypothetical protein